MNSAFLYGLEERFLRHVQIDITVDPTSPIQAQPSTGRMRYKTAKVAIFQKRWQPCPLTWRLK